MLDHTLKGVGIHLGISKNLDAVTKQYVDVQLERKQEVLETYHNAVFPSRERSRQKGGQKQRQRRELDRER